MTEHSAYDTAIAALNAIERRAIVATDQKLAYAQIWATLAVAEACRRE